MKVSISFARDGWNKRFVSETQNKAAASYNSGWKFSRFLDQTTL
jgi:hypothetical protein